MILNSNLFDVYLSLGSNIEPCLTYLNQAGQIIKEQYPDNFQISSFYSSQSYLNSSKSTFFNQAVRIKTVDSAQDILKFCQQIENQLKRKRSRTWGDDRTIDVDILLYGEQIISQSDLIIPHYDLENRDFFLIPLLELNQNLRHPKSQILIESLINNLKVTNDLQKLKKR